VTAFLNSIGYNSWILPVLLGLPLAGALALFAQGSAYKSATPDAAMRSSRSLALWVFIAEAVLSLGSGGPSTSPASAGRRWWTCRGSRSGAPASPWASTASR
jgi:hypothetical protein